MDNKIKLAVVAVILALVAGRFYDRMSKSGTQPTPPPVQAVEPEPAHEVAMPPGLVGDRWELPEVRDNLSLLAFSAWLQASEKTLVRETDSDASGSAFQTEFDRIGSELDDWRRRLARRALETMRRQYDLILLLLRNEVLDSRLLAADRAELGAFAKAVQSRQDELEQSSRFNSVAFQNMAEALGEIARSLDVGTQELKSQSLVNFQEILASLLEALSSAQSGERRIESDLTLLIGSSKRYHRTANLDSWTLTNQAAALEGFRLTDHRVETIRTSLGSISGSLKEGAGPDDSKESLQRLREDFRALRADLESRFFENLQMQLDVLNRRDRNLRDLKEPLSACFGKLAQFEISERNLSLQERMRQVPEVVETLHRRSGLFEDALLGNLGSQLEAIRFHLESHLYEMDPESLKRFQAHLSNVEVRLRHEALRVGGEPLKALLEGLSGQLSGRLAATSRTQGS